MIFHHKIHPHTARNVNDIHDEQMGAGDRIADQFANVIGSWYFILVQAGILVLWFFLNSVAWCAHFDGYPFILCNLFMSAEAAFATPLVLMSQNRQAAKDRITAEETWKNAKKSEEETRAVMEHLAAQDTELLKQTNELLRHTQMLEVQATRVEKLMRRIDQATGRGAA